MVKIKMIYDLLTNTEHSTLPCIWYTTPSRCILTASLLFGSIHFKFWWITHGFVSYIRFCGLAGLVHGVQICRSAWL